MNCDRAFDLMTAPDGVDNPALARHLAACPRCQQMQDTLSPALNWFAADDTVDWTPSPQSGATTTPLLSMQAVRVAETAARDLSHRRTAFGWRRVLSIAALLFCGAALGVAAFDGRQPAAPASAPVPSKGLMTACLWTDSAQRSRLSAPSPSTIIASCVVCHVPHDISR
jgi:hypothetical protein